MRPPFDTDPGIEPPSVAPEQGASEPPAGQGEAAPRAPEEPLADDDAESEWADDDAEDQGSTPTIELSGELPTSPDAALPLDGENDLDSDPAVVPASEFHTSPNATLPWDEPAYEARRRKQTPSDRAVSSIKGLWQRSPRWAVVAASVTLIALVAMLLALPSKGALVISVASPSDRAVKEVRIVVDDEPRCEESPCHITGLSAGAYTVEVTAPGYEPATQFVEMRSGFDLAVNVKLQWPSDGLGPVDLGLPEDSEVDEKRRSQLAEQEAEARRAGKKRLAKALPKGTIKANSIPISRVVVDGRPVGTTPTSVKTSPGLHSVVFIHPKYGRKSVTVRVSSRRQSVAAVRFVAR